MAQEAQSDRIGSMLQQVAAELGPWITARNGWPNDVLDRYRGDPQQQFKAIINEWHRTFRDHLEPADKTYVFELKDVRNSWAHHAAFTADDVWRALDTAQRLMRSIGSNEAADRLAATKRNAPNTVAASSVADAVPLPPSPLARASLTGAPNGAERSVENLPAPVVERAGRALEDLVDRAGGAAGRSSIPIDHLDALADLFDAWAAHHGQLEPGGGLVFGPTPGLWHALQGLAPLDDPNRWNTLRAAVVQHLEAHRSWVRESPPRGARFHIQRP